MIYLIPAFEEVKGFDGNKSRYKKVMLEVHVDAGQIIPSGTRLSQQELEEELRGIAEEPA